MFLNKVFSHPSALIIFGDIENQNPYKNVEISYYNYYSYKITDTEC